MHITGHFGQTIPEKRGLCLRHMPMIPKYTRSNEVNYVICSSCHQGKI